MSIHEWKHPKPTVNSKHFGHWVINTVPDLIRLLTGAQLPNVKGRSSGTHTLFRSGSSGLHRDVGNTYLLASTENVQPKVSVSKLVTG